MGEQGSYQEGWSEGVGGGWTTGWHASCRSERSLTAGGPRGPEGGGLAGVVPGGGGSDPSSPSGRGVSGH